MRLGLKSRLKAQASSNHRSLKRGPCCRRRPSSKLRSPCPVICVRPGRGQALLRGQRLLAPDRPLQPLTLAGTLAGRRRAADPCRASPGRPRNEGDRRFRGIPDRFWILRDGQDPSICLHDPGFAVDATVESDLATMYEVWLGRRDLNAAIRAGEVEIDGVPAIAKRLSKAMLLSPIAYASNR